MPLPSLFTRFAFSALLMLAASAPATSLAVEPVRVVATGGRMGNNFYKVPTGKTAFRQRTPHKLGGPVAEIQIGFMDWMYPYDAETPNATNDVTLTHAWLERASTGQVVPLTFSGSRQLVLPMNSITPYWLSDPIPASAWTGNSPVRDEVFWLHVEGTVPEGGKLPIGTPASYAGARFITYPPANDPGIHDIAGPVPTITGSASLVTGLPLIFLGRFTEPGHLAVIGIGDSILDGTGDAPNPVPVIAGYGFFNRAALDSNGSNTIATFNLTRHGQTASNWANPNRQFRQTPFLKFANVVVEEYGTNDLAQAGTGDPAAILSRVQTIWATARAQGVQKIVRTLLLPRTSSTDAWTTVEGQTPFSNWGAGEKRDTINASLIAALTATDPNHRVDRIVDSLAVLADTTDTGRWRPNGVNKYTTDGTHVSPTGNALLGVALRAALLSLTVDENAPNYSNWSKTVDWADADSSPLADPNGDDINNQLAYALNLDPLSPAPVAALPSVSVDTVTAGGPWLSFDYRENKNAADLVYTVISSTDLAAWSPVIADGINAVSEIAHPDPDGDGTTVLRRLRVRHSSGSRFLRLGVLR